MKIEFNRDALHEALKLVGAVVRSGHPQPVLHGIQIAPAAEGLDLVATDLEVGVRHRIVPDSVEDAQAVVVPAAILVGIVREVRDEVITLTVDDGNKATVKAGRSRFRLELYDADDFPGVPSFPETGEEIFSEVLDTMIERTIYAVSSEEGRYAINAMHVAIKADSITLVATDGRRLAVATQKRKGAAIEPDLLLPRKALKELQKRLVGYEGAVTIATEDNQTLFLIEDTTYIARQVEGNFPRYTDVIPKDAERKIRLDRDELMIKLRQAQLMAHADYRTVRFNFKPLLLKLETQTPGAGAATVEMASDCEDEFSIGFNPDYVVDVLRVLDSSEAVLELKTESHPVMIRDGENYTHIIMPVTVQE